MINDPSLSPGFFLQFLCLLLFSSIQPPTGGFSLSISSVNCVSVVGVLAPFLLLLHLVITVRINTMSAMYRPVRIKVPAVNRAKASIMRHTASPSGASIIVTEVEDQCVYLVKPVQDLEIACPH